MSKTQFCIGASASFSIPVEDQIRLFQKCGFDGFFVAWNEKLPQRRALADELGMMFQSIHAPFSNAAHMWRGDELGVAATEELLLCVEDTAKVNVPILVIHPYKGFSPASPTEAGLVNFGKVVARAKELGVKIAFENVEGEAFLSALMDAFASCDHVGFCWDSGHELCYNKGRDMLALYGDRLIATHINDNLGVTSPSGGIFWTDDLHLLPFDGIHDWVDVAHRLDRCGYDGILTLELTRQSKPGRTENNRYMDMEIEAYLKECYARVCKLAEMRH